MSKPQGITQAEKSKQALKQKREQQNLKKEAQINRYNDDEILNELKAKGLPTFGTSQEKRDRLKKHHGIVSVGQAPSSDICLTHQNSSGSTGTSAQQKKALPKSSVVNEIERLKAKREERRLKMEEAKREKDEKKAENEALGKNCDVEFELMIEDYRFQQHLITHHVPSNHVKLCVCVRKRPIFQKEQENGEIDAVSCANPQIMIHEPKYKVDGITKFIDNSNFTFDNTFNQNENNEDVYKYTLEPHLDFLLNQGVVTCFAYGQTGSGKTFTMRGLQESVINDLFKAAQTKYRAYGIKFGVSFFEIYGGKCYDLLNKQAKLNILEDKNQNVQIQGLEERYVMTNDEMLDVIEYGNSVRTTHQTVANDTSSRSHAICSITIRDGYDRFMGKLLLVDLAGSERAQDTQSNNKARRIEGAEINKSLLALKECIRAMDNSRNSGGNHIPFRGSKLTLVLRDSFTSKNNNSKIVMIACVSPGSTSADHTLNTLRYADRLKDRTQQGNLKGAPYVPEDNESLNIANYHQSNPVPQRQIVQNNYINTTTTHSSERQPLSSMESNITNQLKQYQQQQQQEQQQLFQQQQQQQQQRVIQKGDINAMKNPVIPSEAKVKNITSYNNEVRANPKTDLFLSSKQQEEGSNVRILSDLSSNENNIDSESPQNRRAHQQFQQIAEKHRPQQKQVSHQHKLLNQEQVPTKEADISIDEQDIGDSPLNLQKINHDRYNGGQNISRFQEREAEFSHPQNQSYTTATNTVKDQQDEIFLTHMAAIKEDAKLLTRESELISLAQQPENEDEDPDIYAAQLEEIIQSKFRLYSELEKKVSLLRKRVKNEKQQFISEQYGSNHDSQKASAFYY